MCFPCVTHMAPGVPLQLCNYRASNGSLLQSPSPAACILSERTNTSRHLPVNLTFIDLVFLQEIGRFNRSTGQLGHLDGQNNGNLRVHSDKNTTLATPTSSRSSHLDIPSWSFNFDRSSSHALITDFSACRAGRPMCPPDRRGECPPSGLSPPKAEPTLTTAPACDSCPFYSEEGAGSAHPIFRGRLALQDLRYPARRRMGRIQVATRPRRFDSRASRQDGDKLLRCGHQGHFVLGSRT